MPYDNRTMTSIQLSKTLNAKLVAAAKACADKEGLTKIERPQMLERLLKRWADTESK